MAVNKTFLLILFFVLMIFSRIFFDSEVSDFISGIENRGLDFAANVLSHTIFLLFVLAVCGYILKNKKKILCLFGGVGVSYVVSVILKFLIQRDRPVESGLNSFSFPSSHATVYFFIFAFMLWQSEKNKYWFLLIVILVSLSRIYLGVHYLSDIIGGGLLGVGMYLLLRKWKLVKI